jgi:hypothetical protein
LRVTVTVLNALAGWPYIASGTRAGRATSATRRAIATFLRLIVSWPSGKGYKASLKKVIKS